MDNSAFFSCQQCSRYIYSLDELFSHMRQVHSIRLGSLRDTRIFQCYPGASEDAQREQERRRQFDATRVSDQSQNTVPFHQNNDALITTIRGMLETQSNEMKVSVQKIVNDTVKDQLPVLLQMEMKRQLPTLGASLMNAAINYANQGQNRRSIEASTTTITELTHSDEELSTVEMPGNLPQVRCAGKTFNFMTNALPKIIQFPLLFPFL